LKKPSRSQKGYEEIPTSSFLFIGSQEAFAAGGAPCGDYGECDSFKPELNNMESLQLGALTFINHCYGCHSLKYSRWGRIAKDLDIPEKFLMTI
jgi:hypothetical protein